MFQLCYEQQCIPVSELGYVQLCPLGVDGSVCSKRGVRADFPVQKLFTPVIINLEYNNIYLLYL